jgi:hypothetical protein
MIVEDTGVRRPESNRTRPAGGWTALHSWIFLGIVAFGLLVIGLQNRYHYLSPLGLGKAYRIDKLFGAIQEFDPAQGWVKAQIPGPVANISINPSVNLSMAEPQGGKSAPMQMPGMMNQPAGASEPMPRPGAAKANAPAYAEKEPEPDVVSTPAVREKPQPAKELSKEERLKAFHKQFPEYGEEEFQLANDDLYPNWKKKQADGGDWQEFLNLYGDFIKWWTDKGSPAYSPKLWDEFLAERDQ